MRFMLAIVACLSLQACASVEEDPTYQKFVAACEDGDMDACAYKVMMEQQVQQQNARAAQAMADGFDGMTMNRPRQTTCTTLGSTMNCSTW